MANYLVAWVEDKGENKYEDHYEVFLDSEYPNSSAEKESEMRYYLLQNNSNTYTVQRSIIVNSTEPHHENDLKLTNKLSFDYPEAFQEEWDNLEIERCREENGATEPIHDENDIDPNDFYSVYVHQVEGGVMCIADLPTEKTAIDFMALVNRAVRTFKHNGYLPLHDDNDLKEKLSTILKGYENRFAGFSNHISKDLFNSLSRELTKLFI